MGSYQERIKHIILSSYLVWLKVGAFLFEQKYIMTTTRKSFILHFDSLSILEELEDVEAGKLFKKIRAYNLWEKYESWDKMVEILFHQFKNQFDRDLEKYEKICERNRENGLKWGSPKKPNKTQKNPKEPTGVEKNPKEPYNKNDNKSDNNNKSNIIVSKDTELTLKPITVDINNLIQELKEQADILWIAYDKNKERMFAKHIMNTKEYWSFCKKLWMTRIEFAKNIMKASERIWYWKWTCSWPMSIYQNYSDVYNQTKTKSESSKPKEGTWYEWVAIITDEI